METLNFTTNINASKDKVWNVLWDDASYRKWTNVFSEGSYAETDWQEGSKVLFLDGSGKGMVSKIEKITPNEYMSFKHLGMYDNGVEDTSSPAVEGWAGATENYTLEETGGNTTLTVEMNITEQFKSYFTDTWPKAMEQIKHLAENN